MLYMRNKWHPQFEVIVHLRVPDVPIYRLEESAFHRSPYECVLHERVNLTRFRWNPAVSKHQNQQGLGH